MTRHPRMPKRGGSAPSEALFAAILLATLLITGLWAVATIKNGRNLYLQARRPRFVLSDLAQLCLFSCLICFQNIGQWWPVPCVLVNISAALSVIAVHAFLNMRGMQLIVARQGAVLGSSSPGDKPMLVPMKTLTRKRLRSYTRCGVMALGGLGALMASLATAGVPACLSDMCQRGFCPFAGQYLLLLPVILILHARSLRTWRLLRCDKEGLIERVGLQVEYRDVLFYPKLPMTASFVILICIDTGRLPGEPWAMVSDACWLLVFAARFWIMHLRPSTRYGYAPRLWPAFRSSRISPVNSTVSPRLPGPLPRRLTLQTPADVDAALVQARKRVRGRSSSNASASLSHVPTSAATSFGNILASFGTQPPSPRSTDMAVVSSAGCPSPRLSSSSSQLHQLPVSARRATEGHCRQPPEALTSRELLGMCLDDVLGDEAATLRFRAFCRSLLAEHLVVFLLQLRPYHLRTDGSMVGSRVMPADELHELYVTFMRTDSPTQLPLPAPLLKAIRQYCEPSASDASKTVRPLLAQIMEAEEEGRHSSSSSSSHMHSTPKGSLRMFQGTTGRLTQGSSSASTDAPVLAMSTIAALLELAYLEVHSLLADEALPLFKEFCCLEEAPNAHHGSQPSSAPSSSSHSSSQQAHRESGSLGGSLKAAEKQEGPAVEADEMARRRLLEEEKAREDVLLSLLDSDNADHLLGQLDDGGGGPPASARPYVEESCERQPPEGHAAVITMQGEEQQGLKRQKDGEVLEEEDLPPLPQLKLQESEEAVA